MRGTIIHEDIGLRIELLNTTKTLVERGRSARHLSSTENRAIIEKQVTVDAETAGNQDSFAHHSTEFGDIGGVHNHVPIDEVKRRLGLGPNRDRIGLNTQPNPRIETGLSSILLVICEHLGRVGKTRLTTKRHRRILG